MRLNSFFESLQDFFYATFEFIPVVGTFATYFFSFALAGFFFYWLSVLAKQK